jgi:hypothetical protein
MDKVRNPSNSVCYTPSSEPYKSYFMLVIHKLLSVAEHLDVMLLSAEDLKILVYAIILTTNSISSWKYVFMVMVCTS